MSDQQKVLLQLRNFSVSYGPVEAVHQIDLDVRQGEIVTVIGPNGAGKTTLLGAAMGLLPARGEITYDGEVAQGPARSGTSHAGSVRDLSALGRTQRATGFDAVRRRAPDARDWPRADGASKAVDAR